MRKFLFSILNVKHFRGGVENATIGFPKIYPAKRFANYAFGGLHIIQPTNQVLSRLDKEMPRWPSYDKHTTLITKNTTNHCYLHDLDLISKVQSKTRQQFMGMTLAINESATPDMVPTIQAGSDPRWEGGKEIATPRTVESDFIHHDFLRSRQWRN